LQLAVDTAAFAGGARGNLAFARIPCRLPEECFGSCGTDGYCNWTSTLYVDERRPDYVFGGIQSISAASPTLHAVGATAVRSQDSVADTGLVGYAGTMILDVSGDARGTFTIGFNAADTRLWDQDDELLSITERVVAKVSVDCNRNRSSDASDIIRGLSVDCNANGVPDECDVADGASEDCDAGGVPDECQSDCDANGTIDRCELPPFGAAADCNGNNVPDPCDIAEGVSQDCNANAVPDECETDCNGNASPDDCDLAFGAASDGNGNGVPDECDLTPAVAAVGGRRLVVTPAAGDEPVALQVTASLYPCWRRYIAPTGRLAAAPAYLTTAEWAALVITDRDIIPGTTYRLQTIRGAMTSAPAPVTTARWGDTVGRFASGAWTPPDGRVDIVDASAALDRFRGAPRAPPLAWCDIAPAVPDGAVDITSDVVGILGGFRGLPYPYATPSPCP
jgi:hypothetical protein